jgi:hypothetical protein
MNWLVNVSLLILLASLIVLGISVIRYRKQRALQSPVTLFYARLCRVTSLVGSPPELAQTPYEYTFLLSKRFPQLSGMLRRLADLVVRERWATAQQAPTPMEKQELIRGWPRLRNTILRSFFSRNR